MKYGNLIVEKREADMVRKLIASKVDRDDVVRRSSVGKLASELAGAQTLTEPEMPQDIVRLNSVVTIRAAQNREQTFKIVLPAQSDISRQRLSLLAPMGLALFGYAESDEVTWEFPSGVQQIQIVSVTPPETEAE